MISVDLEFFKELIDSLKEMTDYADDGMISREDTEYKDFFDAIDKANEICNKANEILEDEIVPKFVYSINDLVLLYYQDIEYLIKILNANKISLKEYLRYDEIMTTLHHCYKKCQDLGYYEKEDEQ